MPRLQDAFPPSANRGCITINFGSISSSLCILFRIFVIIPVQWSNGSSGRFHSGAARPYLHASMLPCLPRWFYRGSPTCICFSLAFPDYEKLRSELSEILNRASHPPEAEPECAANAKNDSLDSAATKAVVSAESTCPTKAYCYPGIPSTGTSVSILKAPTSYH